MKEAELHQARELSKQKEEAESSQLQKQGILLLPESERERILVGLEENWSKLNHDYQRLSLTRRHSSKDRKV